MDYLLALSALGQTVQSDGEDYVLPIEGGEARIAQVGGLWRISHTRYRVLSTYGDASTEPELDKLLRMAVGAPSSWPAAPEKGRLAADKPASNYRTIASLIGNGEIQAIFDTYLDNEGLETVNRILSFGNGCVANGIRLLGTTTTTTGSTGKPPRFSKAGVDAWSGQLGIQAEARVLPQGSEHRRFLLLEGHRSLILGPSLNSLKKNEAVAIEDDTEDHPFFDKQWLIASPLK
jgi:hypothetical protein